MPLQEQNDNPLDGAHQGKPPRGNTFLIVLAVLMILAGSYATWYFFNPTPEYGDYSIPITKNEPIANWQTYRNEKYGFEIKYPPNYTLNSNGTIMSDYVVIHLGEYYKHSIQGTERTVNGIRMIELPIGGNRDGGIEYQLDIPDKNMRILFNGRNANSYEHKDEYNQILSTFKFIDTVQTFNTREECEQKTGEMCLIDFGDYVLPTNPIERQKALECISKIPKGWVPESEFLKLPKCEWDLE